MNLFKKAMSIVLAGAICLNAGLPVLAAEKELDALYDRAVAKYVNGEHEFIKISHPEKNVSSRDFNDKQTDGLLDYLGEGKVGVPGVDAGANGQGDRGQTYSWAAISHGDYMYVSTLYSAMMTTIGLMGSGMGHQFTPEVMESAMRALYRNDFFVSEEDGANAGSTLCKINVKTGEVEVLMSKTKTGTDTQFRNATKYNGKLYFCGSVDRLPCVYEIDPETDEFKMAYADESMLKPGAIQEAFKKGIIPAIRGIGTFKDYLIISCVGVDGNPYIAVSNDPSKGFTKIASAWEDVDNGVKGELFGYPACKLDDSIYGGSIWGMVEFNGDLYVSCCTGTPANSPDGGKTMQSFAIIRGECNGEIDDPEAWTWTPVIGDKEDGAKYTFGIDPERTRAGACEMAVLGDHLYIGEYNDTEIALVRVLFGLDAEFLADNLKQSVSLYRMDKDENIELVAGNPTEMFPESLSGLKSGFGSDETVYENQYIWQMKTFQDKLYIGTFDETSLLYPVAQISNGDLFKLSPEEWKAQLVYLKEFIKEVIKDAINKENVTEDNEVSDNVIDNIEVVPEITEKPDNKSENDVIEENNTDNAAENTDVAVKDIVVSEEKSEESSDKKEDSNIDETVENEQIEESTEKEAVEEDLTDKTTEDVVIDETITENSEEINNNIALFNVELETEEKEEIVLPEAVAEELAKDTLSDDEIAAKAATVSENLSKEDFDKLVDLLDVIITTENDLEEMEDLNILNLPSAYADKDISSFVEFYQMSLILPYIMEEDENWSAEETIAAKNAFFEFYNRLYEYYMGNGENIPDVVKEIFDKLLNNENFRKIYSVVRCLYYLKDAESGFDMYVIDENGDIDCITTNGMSDPYNHGLRVFAINNDAENPWMCIGTANPFYGTQIWRMEGEGLNLPPVVEDESRMIKVNYVLADNSVVGSEDIEVDYGTTEIVCGSFKNIPNGYRLVSQDSVAITDSTESINVLVEKIGAKPTETPEPTVKPTETPEPTEAPVAPVTPANPSTPNTGDTTMTNLWISVMLISAVSALTLYRLKKNKQ